MGYLNNIPETNSDKIINTYENIKPISIHPSKHTRLFNDIQLGHYLAGLIESNSYFNKQLQLIITFHLDDVKLAYYLKSKIKYGNVNKVKDTYILTITSKNGIIRVINLINNKIRSTYKYNQIMNNIIHNSNYFTNDFVFTRNISNDLNNHWLTGFIDSNGSLQIKILNKEYDNIEIRLNLQIYQKYNELLLIIKDYIGGNIGYNKSQDTYYYRSTSFGSAKNIIKYLDKYQLLSLKYLKYRYWRKTYICVQDKEYLTKRGI